MTYTKTGPFNSGAAPGITNTFLNNVENYLVSINSFATDANISSDGSGNASIAGNVAITTNNKFFKGKDQAGTTYPIAGFNSSTAKQLDILDGTSGQLANIKSNTKVNGSFEATGATTLDNTLNVNSTTTISGVLAALSTLSVLGITELDTGNILTDGTGRLQLQQTGTTTVGSTSGTATFYAPLWGTGLKVFVLSFVNYNSASTTFIFPTSASNGFFVIGNLGGGGMVITLQNGATNQTASIITALGGTGSGTSIGSTGLHGNSIGQLVSTADRVGLGNTGGSSVTTTMIFIGV